MSSHALSPRPPSAQLQEPQLEVGDGSSSATSKGWAFIRDALGLPVKLQQAMQSVAAQRVDGRHLLDIARDAKVDSAKLQHAAAVVDADSLRGAVVLTAAGDIALEASFQPTAKARRNVWLGVAAAVAVTIAVVVIAAVAIARAH